ncbi:MAG TPA: response regulator transcription factor [Candidatus Dormibacteraeota bacterium]
MDRLTTSPTLDLLSSQDPTDQAPAGETTILVIDDDPTIGTMLTMLGREHGFTVQVATDGFEGLRLAEQSDADLIVLDLNLPRLTGLDVCRRIRSAGIEVPIVMVSANHDVVDVVVGLEIGADDYVTKPFELRELAARIGAQLRRQRRSAAQVRPGRLKFPGLVIDFGRHEVLRDGEAVGLTPTEFNLLALLATRPGRVVSRAEMIQQVWGQGAELDARSVDAHVYRLRRKIEPNNEHPTYVHAVPGVGYRFDYRPVGGSLSPA